MKQICVLVNDADLSAVVAGVELANKWTGSQQYKLSSYTDLTVVTLDDTHHHVEHTGSTNRNQPLPTAVGITGKEYVIKNIGTSTVTVTTNASETIDAAATYALTQWEYVRVVSNGTNWIITGKG